MGELLLDAGAGGHFSAPPLLDGRPRRPLDLDLRFFSLSSPPCLLPGLSPAPSKIDVRCQARRALSPVRSEDSFFSTAGPEAKENDDRTEELEANLGVVLQSLDRGIASGVRKEGEEGENKTTTQQQQQRDEDRTVELEAGLSEMVANLADDTTGGGGDGESFHSFLLWARNDGL